GIVAPFRYRNEGIFFLELFDVGAKPGVRVIEGQLPFALGPVDQNPFSVAALIKRGLRRQHGRAGGTSRRCPEDEKKQAGKKRSQAIHHQNPSRSFSACAEKAGAVILPTGQFWLPFPPTNIFRRDSFF